MERVLQTLKDLGLIKNRADLIKTCFGDSLTKAELNSYNTMIGKLLRGLQKEISGEFMYALRQNYRISYEWWYDGTEPMIEPDTERMVQNILMKDPEIAAKMQEFLALSPKERKKLLESEED